jgi:hypothetical protein
VSPVSATSVCFLQLEKELQTSFLFDANGN